MSFWEHLLCNTVIIQHNVADKYDSSTLAAETLTKKKRQVLGFFSLVQTILKGTTLRPRPHKAETGETVPVSIYPVSEYLRKDGVKQNRVDL